MDISLEIQENFFLTPFSLEIQPYTNIITGWLYHSVYMF